jgi:hypothetical protein
MLHAATRYISIAPEAHTGTKKYRLRNFKEKGKRENLPFPLLTEIQI